MPHKLLLADDITQQVGQIDFVEPVDDAPAGAGAGHDQVVLVTHGV